MLRVIGAASLDALVDAALPKSIRLTQPLQLPPAESEHEYLNRLRGLAATNKPFHSFIGMGYYGTITPSVILRNLFENPSWYTPYTPYQAEIAQGRLESLLNFQTMVRDLTAMDIATASLLDEATGAAETMTLLHRVQARSTSGSRNSFWVSERTYPQTLDVLKGRAEPLGITLVIGDPAAPEFGADVFGAFRSVARRLWRSPRFATVHHARAQPQRARRCGDRPARPDRSSRLLEKPVLMWWSAARSGSACRWGMADRTPRFLQPARASSGRPLDASSASRSTSMAISLIEWRCRHGSSISAAKRRRRTSVRPRRSWRTSRRCTASTTGLTASPQSPGEYMRPR